MAIEDVRVMLEEYIIQNQERFYRLAYSHVGNKDGALDVVQNAVVKGLENCGSIRRPEFIKTWFFRVLLNECYGYLRKTGREISVEPIVLQQLRNEGTEERDEREIYEQVLKLPDKMRTVIILRFYEEFSLEEISRATGSGLGAVKYRLYAGLKELKRMCEEESI